MFRYKLGGLWLIAVIMALPAVARLGHYLFPGRKPELIIDISTAVGTMVLLFVVLLR
jgi:hypothetical protein